MIYFSFSGEGLDENFPRNLNDVCEGQRRFALVVRQPDKQRTDPEALAAFAILAAAGPVPPWNQVAKIAKMEGPSQWP
jgi:Cu/Ag efflux pump CusA